MTPSQNEPNWILLSTAVARMGELNPLYRTFRGHAHGDLESAIRAGRVTLRGCRFRSGVPVVELIEERIDSHYRLDIIHNTLVERGRGPQGDRAIFSDVELEWSITAAYLLTLAPTVHQLASALSTASTAASRASLPEGNAARTTQAHHPRRKGPTRGSVDRYGKSDKALFADLSRIMQEKSVSATAAALELAERIRGHGTPESRVKRVVKRFNALKLADTKSR